jgi:hypothetical protein
MVFELAFFKKAIPAQGGGVVRVSEAFAASGADVVLGFWKCDFADKSRVKNQRTGKVEI